MRENLTKRVILICGLEYFRLMILTVARMFLKNFTSTVKPPNPYWPRILGKSALIPYNVEITMIIATMPMLATF
jgi:hypothetical protein